MKEQSVQGPGRYRQSRRRISLYVQLGLVLALVLGIWISWQASQRPTLAVPRELGTLKLAGSTTGPEAKTQIDKLHGAHIELADAYVAEYTGGGARVTAWVSDAGSGSKAAGLLREMLEGIRDGNPVFSNLQQEIIDGREVYSVVSREGKHYFYRDDRKVVWLQIAAIDPVSLVRAALKTL